MRPCPKNDDTVVASDGRGVHNTFIIGPRLADLEQTPAADVIQFHVQIAHSLAEQDGYSEGIPGSEVHAEPVVLHGAILQIRIIAGDDRFGLAAVLVRFIGVIDASCGSRHGCGGRGCARRGARRCRRAGGGGRGRVCLRCSGCHNQVIGVLCPHKADYSDPIGAVCVHGIGHQLVVSGGLTASQFARAVRAVQKQIQIAQVVAEQSGDRDGVA